MTNQLDLIAQTPLWRPDREAAKERLAAFLPNAGRAYAEGRNSDLGPQDRSNVSALSPWIRHRLLLEEEVLGAVLVRHSPQAAEKFIQEVVWRAYFKGWLEHRPGVWADYRRAVEIQADRVASNGGLARDYAAAIEGRTGIECFDVWARELIETGYLHNHARMWFASIWVYTLNLPWALGADFFQRHLLDADPASNTCSWRWVCGLHTIGKTYLARPDNIARFTGGRFETPRGLATEAPPLDEGGLPEAVFPDLPGPADLAAPYLLLISEEDGDPASLIGTRPAPAGLIGLSAAAARSPGGMSEMARAFTHEAIADALARARSRWDVEGEQPATQGGRVDWAEALIGAASALGVDRIVTAFAPQGPAREALDAARPALAGAGLELVEILRPYDRMAWPHSAKGFFKMKAKIPDLLAQIGARRG